MNTERSRSEDGQGLCSNHLPLPPTVDPLVTILQMRKLQISKVIVSAAGSQTQVSSVPHIPYHPLKCLMRVAFRRLPEPQSRSLPGQDKPVRGDERRQDAWSQEDGQQDSSYSHGKMKSVRQAIGG